MRQSTPVLSPAYPDSLLSALSEGDWIWKSATEVRSGEGRWPLDSTHLIFQRDRESRRIGRILLFWYLRCPLVLLHVRISFQNGTIPPEVRGSSYLKVSRFSLNKYILSPTLIDDSMNPKTVPLSEHNRWLVRKDLNPKECVHWRRILPVGPRIFKNCLRFTIENVQSKTCV